VSVQTLYTHFGSKGGLLAAVFDEEMAEPRHHIGFGRAWKSRHGEAALRSMLEATLTFWQRAWPMIEFALRVRRTDTELGARIEAFDERRLETLLVICRRIDDEGRLRRNLSAARAARFAFGLSTPYVYEALIVQNGLPITVARGLAVEAVMAVVIEPGSRPVSGKPIDWAQLGLPPSGAGRG
jgi:AcrR family transcriptional regulator